MQKAHALPLTPMLIMSASTKLKRIVEPVFRCIFILDILDKIDYKDKEARHFCLDFVCGGLSISDQHTIYHNMRIHSRT